MNAPTGQIGISRRPWWVNYGAAVLIQAALTAFLAWLYPYFPLGKFPAPYAAALLVTVLVFGQWPAIVALALSLLSFHYFFVPPIRTWALPSTAEEWASVAAYILVNGIVVLAVGIIQSARRRAEQLAESLQEHAQILDMAHVLIRDADDRIIVWNTGLESLYGFTKKEAIGRVSHDLFQTVFPESKEAFTESLEKTGHWQGELMHIAKDGSKVAVASHQVLHRNSEGKPVAVLEVDNDITGRVQAQRALQKALRDLAVANEDKEMMNEELKVSNDELLREVMQRAEAEEELRKSEALLRAVTDGSPDPIFLKDRESRMLMANPATLRAVGKSAEEIIGKTDMDFYDDPEVGRTMVENDRLVMESGKTQDIEEIVSSSDGPRVFRSTKTPWRDANGNVIGLLGIAYDITESKRAEQEREMTVEFLQIINRSSGADELVETSAKFFQRVSGCEAVGIRLRTDHDYPYSEAQGFSNGFVEFENSLCALDADGCILRDSQGYPIYECMCGNIIQGRFDPSKPFFTEHGSFWTNCTTELLASSTEADRQARTRNRCNGEGYESVALIPLHVGEERLGLLQLNDHKKGLFSLAAVGLWERFADYLAVALTKFQAEEALKESEGRYRTLFTSMTEGFALCEIILDAAGEPIDFRYLEVNDAFEQHTGMRAADVLGKTASQVIPGIEPFWAQTYGRVALTGEPCRFESRVDALDRDFEVFAFSPTEGRFAALFLDISDRKRAEDALRESEERFRAMANSIPQLAWMAEPDGNIFWYNRRWYEYTGTTPEQMEGWGWQSVHDPDVLPRVVERWESSLATGEPFDMEFPLLGADGRFRPFLTRVEPLKDPQGRVVRWFGTNTDVSEARELDAHKREFYRQTILAATDGKLVISERDEIEKIAGRRLREWQIDSIEGVGVVRVEATAAARRAGMAESKIYDFMACVVESTGNAAKHAKRGHASLHQKDGKLVFVVSDAGPGISAMSIPDVAFTRGYTTAGTLGMGYKVMISFADKVYLATGPEGTTVALEMALGVPANPDRSALASV